MKLRSVGMKLNGDSRSGRLFSAVGMGFECRQKQEICLFPKRPVQHWAHPDSCGMGTGGRSTVVMRTGREADKLPAPSNEDKARWSWEFSWAVAPQRKENLSFLCRLIELSTPVKCVECG